MSGFTFTPSPYGQGFSSAAAGSGGAVSPKPMSSASFTASRSPAVAAANVSPAAAGAAAAQQQQQQQAPFCGIVASGRPVVMSFTPVGGGRFTTVVAQPAVVPEISAFLLPAFQPAMAQGLGLSVYWCKDGANWQLLGSLSAHKPSDIFRTGWPQDAELTGCPAVQLGVAVESLAQIQTSAGHGSQEVGGRLQVAKSVAQNLFQYMESFTQRHQQNGQEWLILPTDCLSKWLQRFERKLRLDPGWFQKNSNGK